jgi:hypothetical protein
MGREIRCMAELRGWTGDGRLLLETDELIFRGAQRAAIPLKSITSVRDDKGWLVVEHAGEVSRFDLGKLTPSWVNAIANPKSRADKLDVKPGTSIAIVGGVDEDFLEEVRARTPLAEDGSDPVDLIFVRVATLDELEVLPAIRARIRPTGAIWLIHPKGDGELNHAPIVEAAKKAGLIDVKTARFSDTHTALKLMIPKSARS